MAPRSSRKGGPTGLPKPLRPIVGGIALVATIRLIDGLWRRVTGRPTPVTEAAEASAPPVGTADEARLVRDRVAYAFLLSGAMRLARRLGLPKDDAGQ